MVMTRCQWRPETLLYGQMQEGLCLRLMRGPAVSGAGTYQELCIAARNEEKRLADLKRRQEYSQPYTGTTPRSQRQPRTMQYVGSSDSPRPRTTGSPVTTPQGGGRTNLKCFYCGKQGHRKADCRRRQRDEAQPAESRGPSRSVMMKQIRTQQGNKYSSPQDSPPSGTEDQPQHSTLPVPPSATSSTSQGERELDAPEQSLLDLLFSNSDREGVKQVRVPDCGSRPHLARVDIHGVPADGIVDTAADITIMSGKLFALAAAAKLRKCDFKKPDRVPRNYDGKEFHLDGCMEMDLTFHDITLTTSRWTPSISSFCPRVFVTSWALCRITPLLLLRKPRSARVLQPYPASELDSCTLSNYFPARVSSYLSD